MCGIVGIARPDGGAVSAQEIDLMAAAVEHRGPDEGGRHLDSGIGLGIRRLKIIDLETGSQPIANEDESVWVVLNGEVYNFRSLREQLRALGHTFRSLSDTEAIVHAYEEYGDDCVNHLRGMFAFALWDAKRRRLLVARDRLGKKPLVYAYVDNVLYFASEIQALMRIRGVRRDLDWGGLGDYLAYGYVPAPATIFRSIRKLLPGQRLTWHDGQLQTEQYWQLRYLPKLRLSETDAEQELERRLTEAVGLRLIADVPLGALLSGGVDSSVVVALMSRMSPGRVKTFSVGFEDASFDELAHARRVARQYGTDHHEFILRPEAADVLPTLVRHYGEPYADSSAIPTYYVSKLARQYVTVALNGDGGDESFAGYDRYLAMSLVDRFPRALFSRTNFFFQGSHARSLSSGWAGRAFRLWNAAALPTRERYARLVATIPDSMVSTVLTPELATLISSERALAVERTFDEQGSLGLVDRLLATDVTTYLLNDLLVKMDIASMANSLETRSPLLDHEVVEFAAQLPATLKLHWGFQQKYLLKRLARRLIPAENIDRRKMGFGVPVGQWLRGPLKGLAADALLSPRLEQRGYFQRSAINQLWVEHQGGARNHTYPLWTLLMLELWHQEFVDNDPSSLFASGAAQ